MHIVSTALLLQQTGLFLSRFLSADDRDVLASIAAKPRMLGARTRLISEGERVDFVYLITQGWACRYKAVRNGTRQIIGIATPGDACNVDSFMVDRLSYDIAPLTDAVVMGLPRERLEVLATERPSVCRAFTQLAVAENAILGEWALSLGRQSARERLAHFFCEMAVRLVGPAEVSAVFDLPVTQEQMGDALGLTSVHVNRTMTQLRSDGLIVVEHRRITVPDMVKLSRVGGFDHSYLQGVIAP